MKIFLLIFWMILGCSTVNAQTISGTIKNTQGKPLPYATCYLINNRVGISTNDEGKYIISLPVNKMKQVDTLSVSYIGYEEQRIPVYFGEKNIVKNIILQTTNVTLDEVLIFEKKPLTPEQIIRKTLKTVKKNYSRKEIMMDGFYRETMKENNRWVEMNEAVVRMKYNKYPQRINSKSRMKDYYDDGYQWSYRGSGFIFRFNQFWPYYIAKNDQMEVVSSRLSFNLTTEKMELSPKGGPIDLVSLDKIKFSYDFLDPKNLKKYSYKTVGRDRIAGENCYVIEFMPISGYNQRIYKAFNKRMKQPILAGRMYISTASFALVKYEAQLASHANFSAYDSWGNFPLQIKIEVNYRKLSGDKWIVKDMTSEQVLIYKKKILKCLRELSFYTDQPINNKALHPEKLIRITKSSNLYDFPNEYDEAFWLEYEKSNNYPALPQEVVADLEQKTPLKEQFRYINLTIDDLDPPSARKEPFVIKYKHDTLIDDYHWLTLSDKPKTLDYIQAENKYKSDVMRKMREYSKEYQLQTSYMFKEDTLAQSNIIWYNNEKCTWMQDEDGDQKLFKLLRDSSKTELFNIDFASKKNVNYRINHFNLTNSHVLYSYTTGGGISNTFIAKLRGNTSYIDSIPNMDKFFLINDSTILYTALDSVYRVNRLLIHQIGKDANQDKLLYQEQDPTFDVMSSHLSYSKEKFFIDIRSRTENEIYVLDFKPKLTNPVLIKKRENKVFYEINHFGGDDFYLVKDNTIFQIQLNHLDESSWSLIYKTKGNIQSFTHTNDYLVVKEQEKLKMKLKYIHKTSKKVNNFEFKDEFFAFNFKKPKTDSLNVLQVYYQTPILPECLLAIDLDRSSLDTIHTWDKFHDFLRPKQYKTKILWAKSEDGTKIPIAVFYNEFSIKQKLNGVLLHGYGMYGGAYESEFNKDAMIYAKHGFIVAWALVRGGADLGQFWHDEGILLSKKNTFSDYIACAKFLQEKYKITPQKMVGKGLSAGGLITGYVANNRPDLFNTLVFDRPWLDPINTMTNPLLPLTIDHYKEVGNPNDKEVFDYMMSYSPYQNIVEHDYPNMWFSTGFLDINAPYWQVLESVAKYRDNNTSKSLILSETGMNSGHYLSYSESINSLANQYAFIMYTILGKKKGSNKIEK